jgi:hypothetical protein
LNGSTPLDLRAQVQRLWDRGDLLRACVDGACAWPIRLTLKTPTAADLSDRFEAVRDWVRSVAGIPRVRIEWREWTHRVQGRQRLPAAVFVDTPQDALAWIGKTAHAERFRNVVQMTQGQQPALVPWLLKRPLQALEWADRWPQLLSVVQWLQAHPRPGIYLRQVDVPGVDSKFIEAHRGVLAELLDLALPAQSIDGSASGSAQFARRYGFRDKPIRIRFRVLDAAVTPLPSPLPDITLDAGSFAALAPPVRRVFITENETNFLAFPPASAAIVIFGSGYGWDALAGAEWLQRCDLHYWGDIDTHGFAILDQLRGHFAHTTSFLMDRTTLLAHAAHWGSEPQPARHALGRLTGPETALYDDLRFDRIRPALRLEQERIAYGQVLAYLANAGCTPVDLRQQEA